MRCKWPGWAGVIDGANCRHLLNAEVVSEVAAPWAKREWATGQGAHSPQKMGPLQAGRQDARVFIDQALTGRAPRRWVPSP